MKNIRQFLSLAAIALVLTFAACEEDVEGVKVVEQEDSTVTVGSIQPPTLKVIDSELLTVIKFELRVTASQVQDTVQYLVLEADTEAPTSEMLLDHTDKTELPMAGNYSRVTFEDNLKEQTQYIVYAVVVKEQHASKVVSLTITTGGSTDADSTDG